MDGSSFLSLMFFVGIYFILRTVIRMFLRSKGMIPDEQPTIEMPQDRPDERYFNELQRIMPDAQARELLDQHLESGACSRDLRMRANELILFFQNTRNSLHSEEARAHLDELTDALNVLLTRSGNSADMDAIRPAVKRVDEAYVAYRSHFYNTLER